MEYAATNSAQTTSPPADFAPRQSYRWLRAFLPKRLQPVLRGLRKRLRLPFLRLEEPYRTVYPYTQVHLVRQKNLVRLAGLIDQNRIAGDIAECGVLDGGTAALMANASEHSPAALGRKVHLFDAWEGLPQVSAKDGEAARAWSGEVVGSAARVAAMMRKLGVSPRRVVFHRGWFSDTFPKAAPQIDRLALLHLDADLYESTRLALKTWYPKLSPGAYVQIDDYDSFSGCRTALDEFFAAHPEVQLETEGQSVKAYYFMKPPEGQ
jgi:O-methyltransferase